MIIIYTLYNFYVSIQYYIIILKSNTIVPCFFSLFIIFLASPEFPVFNRLRSSLPFPIQPDYDLTQDDEIREIDEMFNITDRHVHSKYV